MKVELVQHTPNPLKLITDVASICYGKEEANYPERLLKHLNDLGHHSVFEHVYYTFKITGISRACLGQLTRHRHASFSVRSQRYCDEEGRAFIFPEVLKDNPLINEYSHNTHLLYNRLIDEGVKREDARMVLPQATSTDLYMSMNLRELIHVYTLRTSSAAQEEIRDLVNKMVQMVKIAHPELHTLFKEVI